MAGPAWHGISVNAVDDKPARDNFRAINLYLRSVSKSLAGGTAEAPAAGLPGEAYVTIGNTGGLSQERALAVSAPITLSDGGANASVTIGASMVVPAFVLGTTAAAGSAGSLVRSDATIALFDATAPLPLETAAVHGSTNFAADAGHVHEFPETLQSDTNSFQLTVTDDGTILTIASPHDTKFSIGSGGFIDSLTFDLSSATGFGVVAFDGPSLVSQIGWLLTTATTVITLKDPGSGVTLQSTGNFQIRSNTDGNPVVITTDGTRAYNALNFVLAAGATGNVAGVHLNLSNKAGDPSTPVTGDIYRTGALVKFFDGLVINDGGLDTDTRIEGLSDNNLLYINAGNDRVGIGLSDPVGKLDIKGASRAGVDPSHAPALYVTMSSGADASGVEFRHSNQAEGIGFGRTTIYATGSNTNQDLNLKPRGTGGVGIGTITPGQLLDVNGVTETNGFASAIVAKTGAYTLTDDDHVVTCDTSGGAFTITLPATSGRTGRIYHIKKTDSSGNAVTVDGNASETIDGGTTATLSAQYESIMIICDGSNWHII